MTSTAIPAQCTGPQKIEVSGDLVVMGGRAYTMSRPTSAVRWLRRGEQFTLQQLWSVTGQDDNGWNYMHEEWRDVPIEDEVTDR